MYSVTLFFYLGIKYLDLWNTVRKEGNAEQLISLFIDKANQIAPRLKDNAASKTGKGNPKYLRENFCPS